MIPKLKVRVLENMSLAAKAINEIRAEHKASTGKSIGYIEAGKILEARKLEALTNKKGKKSDEQKA
jgi:hypothetical protein